MTSRLILCGSTCDHRHDGVNGPSGCCEEHGPYLYYCSDCHDRAVAANPEAFEKARRLARSTWRGIDTTRAPLLDGDDA